MTTVESVLIDKINELESELMQVKFRENRLRGVTSRLIIFFPEENDCSLSVNSLAEFRDVLNTVKDLLKDPANRPQ